MFVRERSTSTSLPIFIGQEIIDAWKQILMSPTPNAGANRPVPLLDVNRGNWEIRDEIREAISRVVDSGRFLHGPDVEKLEARIAEVCQTKHAISCASGSDALLLALMALDLGPEAEVVVPSFTFFATASCVWRLGCKIVFADIDPRTYNVTEESVAAVTTSRTRAIIPVHLFGQCSQIDRICRFGAERGIAVIEDAAQAIGSAYNGRSAGSWGDMGCLSFYPTKNLGGMGDSGMMTTNDSKLAERLKLFANHGMQPRYHHKLVGINSRLDTIQAAILNVKLDYLATYTQKRRDNAQRYFEMFEQSGVAGEVGLPYRDPAAYHVWNQFSLRIAGGRRDALRQYLTEQQIGSEIYYPIPLHRQVCFTSLGNAEGSLPETERAAAEILHIPIYPEMTTEEQNRVVETITRYYREGTYRRAA
jgi:dTDP-4-amino-4,6-dideoxygalactose transaminase